MCGIAGVVLAGRAPVDPAVLQRMTDTLVHRGPDGQGIFLRPGVGLGHRRLSILDLSDNAAQPMSIPDGPESALSYNGEIYNFATLRRQLGGEVPRSSGDTEVLYRLLRQRGSAALPLLDGQFAFAFWTPGRLLLCRDRHGEKPLYYAPLGPDGRGGLVFASELRALLAHPAVQQSREVDPLAVSQLLFHEYIPAPGTILRNVRKLCAGEALEWQEGSGPRRFRYYTPTQHRTQAAAGAAPTAAFLARVESAVRSRLVSDVPIGVFLSGGLDSSLIAACAVRAAGGRVRTFCIGFPDPSFDESAHAASVARHLGTQHTSERLSESALLDLLPTVLAHQDEPHADSSVLPTSLLCQVVRGHVKVALSGEGGDELLAGYPTFQADRALALLPQAVLRGPAPRLLRALAAAWPPSDRNFSLGFKLRQLGQGLGEAGARRHARFLAALPPEEVQGLLHPDLLRGDGQALWRSVDEAAAGAATDFDAATAFYLRHYLADGVLAKLDRASMRVSLEGRAPLLAPEVVDFCLGLDPRLCLRGMTTKWLLREALRGLVPAPILRRPKKGFGAPVGRWLRGPLRALLQDELSPARLRQVGWLRPEGVARLLGEHLDGRRDHRKPLYALLVLLSFQRRCFG